WLKEHRPGWHIEVKLPPEGSRVFVPLKKRWVSERTNAWNGRCRRHSKDYERTVASSAAMIQVSQIHLMLRRIAPSIDPNFHYRTQTALQAPKTRKIFFGQTLSTEYRHGINHRLIRHSMSQLPSQRDAVRAKLDRSVSTGIRASIRSVIISVALGVVK